MKSDWNTLRYQEIYWKKEVLGNLMSLKAYNTIQIQFKNEMLVPNNEKSTCKIHTSAFIVVPPGIEPGSKV